MSFYVEKVKLSNNKYNYRICEDHAPRGKKRIRKYYTLPVGTSKKDADYICTQMALQAGFGAYITKPPITLNDYANDVYFPKYAIHLSPTTQRNYKQIFNAPDGIKVHLGEKYLAEITTEVVQDMVNHYIAVKLSSKSIKNYVSLVSVILKHAKIDNYLKRDLPNPCEYVIMPKIHSQEGNVYTMEEVKCMLERAKATDNINIQLILALCCFAGGLRRSELAGLRWEDIRLDEDESYIYVQRAIVYTSKDNKVIKEPKTRSGKRKIPIPENGIVYNILQNARKQYMKELSENSDFQGDNHVLISHTAPYAPLKPKKIYKIYKAFLEKEFPELVDYRLHDLRHTYFTWCTETDGFSILSITKTGGHSTIQSTKRYQHATIKRMKEDMKKLEQSFSDAVGGI